MRPLTWEDAEEIALALIEKYPAQNPLELRFTELNKYVTGLEGFADDPHASNEGTLEAIQMAWYDEWQDAQAG